MLFLIYIQFSFTFELFFIAFQITLLVKSSSSSLLRVTSSKVKPASQLYCYYYLIYWYFRSPETFLRQ